MKEEFNNKILFLFTSDFPYGNSEPFIENEIKFLTNNFDKIVIITNNTTSENLRNISDSIKIYRVSKALTLKQKLLQLYCLFSSHLITEIIYNFNYKKIKTIINYLVISQYLITNIYNIIKLESNKYKNIYFYSYWASKNSLVIANLKKTFKNSFAFTRLHGWDLYTERHPSDFLPFRRYIYKNIDKLIFISENGKKYFVEKYNIKNDVKCIVSRLGVSWQNTFLNNSNKDNIFKILSCASIISLKRIDLIIDALSLINDKTIEWRHIGDGCLFDENIEKAKLKLDCKKNITYKFEGEMQNSEINSYYLNFAPHLFINTSSTEGIPVSMMEAMSFGVPVIGTNVGGVSEIIENDLNGILISPNSSSKEIADAIEKLINISEDSYKKIRKNAYKTWDEKYNAKINYTKFINELLNPYS